MWSCTNTLSTPRINFPFSLIRPFSLSLTHSLTHSLSLSLSLTPFIFLSQTLCLNFSLVSLFFFLCLILTLNQWTHCSCLFLAFNSISLSSFYVFHSSFQVSSSDRSFNVCLYLSFSRFPFNLILSFTLSIKVLSHRIFLSSVIPMNLSLYVSHSNSSLNLFLLVPYLSHTFSLSSTILFVFASFLHFYLM